MYKSLLIAVVAAVVSWAGVLDRINDINKFRTQPAGHYSGAAISWTASKWTTVDRAGIARPAIGIDVADTSSGGNLVVHLMGDYTASGAAVLCTLKIPASNTNTTQRIGIIFDRIDSAGTTIKLGGVTVWF